MLLKVTKGLLGPVVYFLILPGGSLLSATGHCFFAEFCEMFVCCI